MTGYADPPAFPSLTEPTAAPAPLAMVLAFVNTADIETGEDALATPEALAAFLAAAGLPGGSGDAPGVGAATGGRGAAPAQEEHARAIRVREALREVFAGNAGHGTDPGAFAVLAAEARQAALAVVPGPTGFGLAAAGSGFDAALATIFGALAGATLDGTFGRLKVCRDDTCRYAFYDESRNRSGTWCSMAVCGNRNKGRAYRRRRGSAAGGAGASGGSAAS